jgi:hypothetical protein
VKILFEWDAVKASNNIRKHGISFDTATRVFADPNLLMEQDRIENGEYRWQTIGLIDRQLLVLVAHTIWDEEKNEAVRMISARPANKQEKKRYEQHRSLRT